MKDLILFLTDRLARWRYERQDLLLIDRWKRVWRASLTPEDR